MEVHHHAHTPRKKWSHYFWEFFMLFLAVTAGFFVENMREHYIEGKRARAYAISMVDDLEQDTVELTQNLHRSQYAVNYLDTFIKICSSGPIENIPSGKLYWYGLWGGYIRSFVPNDATFQQMKSSGSLRYFDNKSISEKVAKYDQLARTIKSLGEIDQPIYLEARKARSRIFDFKYFTKANEIAQSNYKSFDQSKIDSFIASQPQLLSTDKVIFNEYLEMCRSRIIARQLENATDALRLAKELIADLKKEYHLE